VLFFGDVLEEVGADVVDVYVLYWDMEKGHEELLALHEELGVGFEDVLVSDPERVQGDIGIESAVDH